MAKRGRPRKNKAEEPQPNEPTLVDPTWTAREDPQPEERVAPEPAPPKPKPKNEPVMMLEQFLKQAKLNSPALKRFMKKHYGYVSKTQSDWQGIADGIRNRKVQ